MGRGRRMAAERGADPLSAPPQLRAHRRHHTGPVALRLARAAWQAPHLLVRCRSAASPRPGSTPASPMASPTSRGDTAERDAVAALARCGVEPTVSAIVQRIPDEAGEGIWGTVRSGFGGASRTRKHAGSPVTPRRAGPSEAAKHAGQAGLHHAKTDHQPPHNDVPFHGRPIASCWARARMGPTSFTSCART